MRNDFFGTLVLIALILGGAWLLDLHHVVGGERFLYPVVCEMTQSRTCVAKPGFEIGYKITEDGRGIQMWSQSVLLTRLDNCTIRDVRNWACGPVEMRDGDLTRGGEYLAQFTSRSDMQPIVFVPKWRWQAAKFGLMNLDKPAQWP